MQKPILNRAFFQAAGKKRWKGKSKAERVAFAMKGVEARKRRKNGAKIR